MRLMSFALTTAQILAQTKTVTRRMGWKTAKVGDVVQPIVKGQGIPKGGKVERLGCPIRFTTVDRKWITELCEAGNEAYGCSEVVDEGFPDLSPEEFVTMFTRTHPAAAHFPVTRIAFEYLEPKA
jgi:hypothetical protein